MNNTKKRKDSGFTIIEMLIAMVILSVAVLGIGSMVYSVMGSTSISKGMTVATTLMQDKMESLKNTVVSSLTTGSDAVQMGNVSYLRQWTVSPSANTRTITVTVNWNDRGPHNVTTTTLRGE
jgi:prepilin-type N-terminal cleavage/methylation domain-containing protein